MKINFKKITNFINFSYPIGCLEVSDVFLRFLRIDNNKISTATLRLPPGIVESGRIKDKKKFAVVLAQLHKQIIDTFPRQNIFSSKIGHHQVPAIITISASNVFTQIFNLPYLALSKIDEAAKLNLQMISPIDVGHVYSDWQIINEELSSDGGQLELLGAFINSDVAEEYLKALKLAGFSVVALEFSVLSLVRAIKKMSVGIDLNKPIIILYVNSDGLDFMILRNSNLYFNRFVSWQDSTSGSIAMEIQKVINFYYGRMGVVINDLLLVSPNESVDVNNAIKSANLNVLPLNLDKKEFSIPDLSMLVVFGGALRGLMPRSEDNLISLTSLGTKEDYHRNKILYFVHTWRNVFIAVFSTVLVATLAVFWFLYSVSGNLEHRLQMTANIKIPNDLMNLQQTIKDFNNLLLQAAKAKEYSLKWLPTLNQIWSTAGKTITISRLHFDPATFSILIGGHGISEIEVINFKNRLIKNQNFEGVSLPLSQIVKEADRVGFQMSMKVKKKNQ